jgi:recombination protein RecT
VSDTNSPAEIGKAKFATMRGLLEESKAQFARVLPSHMDADRLLRIALTQIRTNPKLLECSPQSMVAALMKAAQLGLEPDGVTGRAYLIPRKNGMLSRQAGRDVYEVIFQRGYKGILDLAYRSGQIASVRADVVRDGDFLEYEKGLNEKLVHRPGASFDGLITHVYAIVTLKGGGSLWDIWSAEKVEAHRQRFSKDTRSDSVWNTDWESMAKKTLLIAVANLAPMAVEWAHAAVEEERGEALHGAGIDVIDMPAAETAPTANTEKLKRAARKAQPAVEATAPIAAGAGAVEMPTDPIAASVAPGALQEPQAKSALSTGGLAPTPSKPGAAPAFRVEKAQPATTLAEERKQLGHPSLTEQYERNLQARERTAHWRDSADMVEVMKDAITKNLIDGEELGTIIRSWGGTRGHFDGRLGLAAKPEMQLGITQALKAACARREKELGL